MDVEKNYKVIVVGDVGVGKTALISRSTKGTFNLNYKATIGLDFATKIIDEKTCFNIWDIAGQERFSVMTRSYYRDARLAIIVYDISRIDTLDSVKKWLNDIRDKVKHNNRDIPVILVGSKMDLKDNDFRYPFEMEEYLVENGFKSWIETSSMTGENVNQVFQKANSILKEEDLTDDEMNKQTPSETIELKNSVTDSYIMKNKGYCCSS